LAFVQGKEIKRFIFLLIENAILMPKKNENGILT